MIQANELRIGNYIGLSEKLGDGNVKIEALRIGESGVKDRIRHSCNMIWNLLEDFNSIPLTPEILIKLCNVVTDEGAGFEANYYRFNINKDGDGLYLRNYFMGGYIWGFSTDKGEFEIGQPKPLEYLHQLQNLIYSLTGQELTPIF